jgi:hypothetical protein
MASLVFSDADSFSRLGCQYLVNCAQSLEAARQ